MKYILYPLSKLYKVGVSARNYLYDSNKILIKNSPLFTVSIGNISWGGTGKTPLCEWILKWAYKQDLLPMLITRGYKGRAPYYPYVVESNTLPCVSGDEPLMLYKSCPFSKIIVDPKKERGLYYGWRKFKPDLAILDDGFQYRRLDRDLDILVFSISDLTLNWNKIIPFGSFRESVASISRSQLILVNSTGYDLQYTLDKVRMRFNFLDKPIYVFHVKIKKVISVYNKKVFNKPIKNYILVAGIGNPQKVLNSAISFLKERPKEFLIYPDHYNYTKKDWFFMSKLAKKNRSIILCTPKDAVKLERFSNDNLYTFELDISFDTKLNINIEFEKILHKAFFKYKSSHGHI